MSNCNYQLLPYPQGHRTDAGEGGEVVKKYVVVGAHMEGMSQLANRNLSSYKVEDPT